MLDQAVTDMREDVTKMRQAAAQVRTYPYWTFAPECRRAAGQCRQHVTGCGKHTASIGAPL